MWPSETGQKDRSHVKARRRKESKTLRFGAFARGSILSAYKKILRALMISRDRLQLLAAARVRLISLWSIFSRRKNPGIFVFKIHFEIFGRATTLYFAYIYATQNRKMERKSASLDDVVT